MAPHVIINCAMSADGKIALPSGQQTRISNQDDMRRVHELRNRCDAVLVGIGTVLTDDPKLTVKDLYIPNPRQPLRIVLDSKGGIPREALVLNDAAPTLIAVSEACQSTDIPGADVVVCGRERIDLPGLIDILDQKGVKRLLVEGGETVIWSFLSEKIADEMFIFIGSMVIGGISSPTPAGGRGATDEGDILPLILRDVRRLGDGILAHYGVKK